MPATLGIGGYDKADHRRRAMASKEADAVLYAPCKDGDHGQCAQVRGTPETKRRGTGYDYCICECHATPATCVKCDASYNADPARLALGNRLCDECMSRPRSTCHDYGPPHAAHDWEQGTAKLWCPGTDGSNPQVPTSLKHLAKKLLANSPTGRLHRNEPEMQDLPRPTEEATT